MSYKIKMNRCQKPRSGMALGGIGAGWFEIRQDGTTENWNIFNNNPLGWGELFPFPGHSMLFFVVKWQYEGEEPRMKLLQIEESHSSGSFEHHEMQYIFPWITGVDEIDYEVRFPFAKLTFSADDMPFDVVMNAWSPFIPFDEKNSSLPAGVFQLKVVSKTDRKLKITLAASQRNAVAYDISERYYVAETVNGNDCRSMVQSAGNVDEKHSSFGTMGVTSVGADSVCYLGWEHPHPYYERFIEEDAFPEVNDVEGRNKVDADTGVKKVNNDRCWSTIAVQRELASGDSFEHTFVATWDFPNNYARNNEEGTDTKGEIDHSRVEGHYYSNFFNGSAQVGEYVLENLENLKQESRRFVDSYYDSDAPDYVLDQVNSNLNTMFASSWFTKEGHFGIIEGMAPTESFAGLSTTDVAMFGSVMYASLFPKLSRQVNRDYAGFQNANGSVAHSIRHNFENMDKREGESIRLDLPAQHAFMSLRDALWSNDETYLRELYPSAKAAVEYALNHRDKNGDGLPDMEGVMCSYDNFPMYGVASFVAGQFVLALRAVADAAEQLGFADDLDKYSSLYENGRKLFEEKLWNGSYFRLCNDEGGENGVIDEGCLTDQLICQWAAHQVGFGHMFDEDKVRSALKSILEHNYRDWQGVRNCQWPDDKFFHHVDENVWVDQANTCWTGVELEFASFLIYEGLLDEGLMVIKNVDDRYRKNGMYFDHQEFGGHYFRPMSAWSIINAMAGLGINAGHYSFAPKLGKDHMKLFFAVPDCYGHLEVDSSGAKISIDSGQLNAVSISIELPSAPANAKVAVEGGDIGEVTVDGKTVRIDFGEARSLTNLSVTV